MFGSVSNFKNRTLQLVRYNIIVVHILKHMHAYLYYSYGSIFGDLNFINTLLAKCIDKFRLAGFDPKKFSHQFLLVQHRSGAFQFTPSVQKNMLIQRIVCLLMKNNALVHLTS